MRPAPRACSFARRTARARGVQRSARWYVPLTYTQVAPDYMLAFRDAYGALVRAQLAEMLKKRDKAKERRVDKLLIASRKKLEENGGRVLIRGAST